MNRLLIILLSITLLTACNKPVIKKELYDDGTVKSEKTYKKIDHKEQLVKEVVFHPNGKMYIEGNYKNELREGYWASWFQNGNLWSEGEFKAGESHGKRTVYHENGKLYYEGTFDMGKRIGVWTFFDENGVKVNQIDYEKNPDVKE